MLQPAGCGDPTFTGAGFDMHSLALLAVRASVELLSPPYRRADWDLLVASFRDGGGRPVAAECRGYSVPIHSDCEFCSETNRSLG